MLALTILSTLAVGFVAGRLSARRPRVMSERDYGRYVLGHGWDDETPRRRAHRLAAVAFASGKEKP